MNFQVVIVVIILDDEGNVADHMEWDWDETKGDLEKDIKNESYDNLGKIADEMKAFVGPENVEALGSALDKLYRKARKLAYESPWEAIAKGAAAGAAAAPFPPLVGVGAGAGGALTDHYKWYNLQTILGGLLNAGF